MPGAEELLITFDRASRTEQNYDYVQFFKDKNRTGTWGMDKYSGTTFPGVGETPPLRIPADTFFFHFHSDGSNTEWGYKFTVSGSVVRKVPRPLRMVDQNLAMKRLVKSSALSLAIRILSSKGCKEEDEEKEEEGIVSDITPGAPGAKSDIFSSVYGQGSTVTGSASEMRSNKRSKTANLLLCHLVWSPLSVQSYGALC